MASRAKTIGDLIAADASVAIPGDGVVLASDLADGSVTTAKLADANVSAAKLASTLDLTGKTVSLNSPTISGNTAFDTDTLYINASDNRVGIGTSSPSHNLQVYSASNPEMRLGDATVTYQLYTDGSTAAITGTVGNHDLVYRTNATERMRISSTGNLLVGTTSGYDGGGGHTFKSPTNHFITTWRTTTSTGNYIHGFVSDVGGVGTAKYAIYANGTAGAISDENYKKNIELARDYLSDINQINVIKYNWKTDEEDANKEIGFSAQQVETIFPTMVDTVTASLEDGSEITHKMLKKDVFLPMAIKCIQELSAKIEDLETRIQALENA